MTSSLIHDHRYLGRQRMMRVDRRAQSECEDRVTISKWGQKSILDKGDGTWISMNDRIQIGRCQGRSILGRYCEQEPGGENLGERIKLRNAQRNSEYLVKKREAHILFI